jgi:sugar phosphate isomerase/epimerase
MNNSEIVNGEFFRKHMFPLAEAVLNQGYDKLSLPLLEHSTLRDKATFTKVRAFIHDLLHRYQNLKISVEVDLSHPEHVLPLIDHERMFLTHDIGNYTATSCKDFQGGSCWYAHQNFLEAIYYAGKLDCIHLKDKNYAGQNVPPGKGNSPFRDILKWLSTRDLSDVLFTLQTAREKPGEEIATIENYMKYFEDYEKQSV